MMNVEKLGGAHALMEKLHSSQEKGLTPTDFEVREQFFSSNFKAPPKMTPYWRLFLNALDDFMLKFLSVCAVVQLVIEVSFADASHRSTSWIEGFAIFMGVFIVATVGSFNDWQKEKQFLRLQAESDKDNNMTVIRNGVEEIIHHNNI
jgi:magnesium-transporting ATPase (P-type)